MSRILRKVNTAISVESFGEEKMRGSMDFQ